MVEVVGETGAVHRDALFPLAATRGPFLDFGSRPNSRGGRDAQGEQGGRLVPLAGACGSVLGRGGAAFSTSSSSSSSSGHLAIGGRFPRRAPISNVHNGIGDEENILAILDDDAESALLSRSAWGSGDGARSFPPATMPCARGKLSRASRVLCSPTGPVSQARETPPPKRQKPLDNALLASPGEEVNLFPVAAREENGVKATCDGCVAWAAGLSGGTVTADVQRVGALTHYLIFKAVLQNYIPTELDAAVALHLLRGHVFRVWDQTLFEANQELKVWTAQPAYEADSEFKRLTAAAEGALHQCGLDNDKESLVDPAVRLVVPQVSLSGIFSPQMASALRKGFHLLQAIRMLSVGGVAAVGGTSFCHSWPNWNVCGTC